MSSIRNGIFLVGMLAVLGMGCGPGEPAGPASEQAPASEQTPGAEQPQAIPDKYLPSGEVQSQAYGYGCCAKCAIHAEYHLLWWVSDNCNYYANSWCNEPGRYRGGLVDAMWGTCRDDL